ncbi:MAG: type I DNA topoisomerase [Myxococcota bacterium]
MKNLLIVESPTKAKTLKRYLGKDFTVKASGGHIIDLPKSSLGVDVNQGFKPHYTVIRGKGKILKELRDVAKSSDRVLLAPDPDREGEAIAWHIAEQLSASNKNIYRVTFNEITKTAVQKAIEKPHSLNRKLFESQQARRILDRLVGYELSPILWKKVQRGLSAGRVQSVAVKLIVDRERAIEAFVPEEYWTLSADLETPRGDALTVKLWKYNGEKAERVKAERAKSLAEKLKKEPFKVVSVEKKRQNRKPMPPYITSRLQRDAAIRLKFATRYTMMVAQQLYEGVDLGAKFGTVGLITYMRTDSFRISEEALTSARGYIENEFGKNYLPEKPNRFKSKTGAQDAHEAIRPTDITLTPQAVAPFLSQDQFKLYELIWQRFIASQMADSQYDQTVVEVEADGALFRASGSILAFDGWQKIFPWTAEGGDEENDKNNGKEKEHEKLPLLNKGELLALKGLLPKQHFTQPPPRFSEGSLVKELEENGIGRPSTYATIVSVIQEKKYVEKDNGRLKPTELGKLVTDLLVKSFPDIIDVEFTAGMEKKLDMVEEGKSDWVALLKDFYTPFHDSLQKAGENMREVKSEMTPTGIKCTREGCDGEFVIRWGRRGQFLGCSKYPDCKNTKPLKKDEEGNIVISEEEWMEKWNEPCPSCKSDLVIRRARNGSRFISCSSYPACKVTLPLPIGVPCPKCGSPLVERRGKKGNLFFGCSSYPACDFMSWHKLIDKHCPKCSATYLLLRKRKGGGDWYLACPEKACDYEETLAEPPKDDLSKVRIAHLWKPGKK